MKASGRFNSWCLRGGAPFVLVLGLLAGPFASAATGRLPEPMRALHAGVDSVVYLDLAGARRSGVWPAMVAQLERLQGAWGAIASGSMTVPGVDLGPLGALGNLDRSWLEGLERLDVAEIVLVSEGVSSPTDPTRLGRDDSFLLVARLAQPLEDQEGFIQRLLGAMDQVENGLGQQVAATRSRVGGAEVWAIPLDRLAQQQVPFPVSLGVGPGEQGSVLALGRTDRLEGYLTGKTSGELPPQLTALVPRRGQFWVYAAIPANASKVMAESDPTGLGAMGGELLGFLDQLRHFALNLDFGATAVDVRMMLGCAGSDVASQLAQQASGMLGIMQMMGGSQVPGLVSRLRATSAGSVFTLATSVTARDVDQLLQRMPAGLGPVAGAAPAAEGTSAARVVVRPPAPRESPVEVEFLQLHPNTGGHLRQGRIRVGNQSDRAVREIRLVYEYLNARGSRVGSWTRQQRDPMAEVLVARQTTREMDVPLFNVPLSAERATVTVLEVVFTDGTKWVAPR